MGMGMGSPIAVLPASRFGFTSTLPCGIIVSTSTTSHLTHRTKYTTACPSSVDDHHLSTYKLLVFTLLFLVYGRIGNVAARLSFQSVSTFDTEY